MRLYFYVLTFFLCTTNQISAQTIPQTNVDTTAQLNVDVVPQFKGGVRGWQKFITQNIDLSRAANNLDSAAYVKYGLRQEAQFEFMVCQDGEICDIKLLNADKISPDFAKEALRVMRRSPKWTPGLIDGKPVRTRFRQAIVAFFDN